MDNSIIKNAILQLTQRADKNSDTTLVSTFVQVGALMPLLLSVNNHILFGRRGTGKTHVLKYLKSKIEEKGNLGIYIDMRLIGSSGSLYSDVSIPVSQRAIRLLSDVLNEIGSAILEYDASFESIHVIAPLVEALSSSIRTVIDGPCTVKNTVATGHQKSSGGKLELAMTPALELNMESVSKDEVSVEGSISGKSLPYIDCKEAYRCLSEITNLLSPRKIWVFIDEFSEVDAEMQVYLADMFKRVFSPNNGIIFKIAAIEHRSHFITHLSRGGYLGLEVGADIASCNLDSFLVFGNNESQACMFFRDLLFNHINSMLEEDKRMASSNDLIAELFTQENAFIELVSAAEGVPRDAFNILCKAIALDYFEKISIPNLRKAARQWYAEDKQKNVVAYQGAFDFLSWIIDVVINKRHAKAFLLKSGIHHPLINYLFDARILHVIKQGISGRDNPGEKYDVYAIDYGCYCDLINTARQPKGLFEAMEDDLEEAFVEVPKDDYRSIRRAILNPSECPYLQ